MILSANRPDGPVWRMEFRMEASQLERTRASAHDFQWLTQRSVLACRVFTQNEPSPRDVSAAFVSRFAACVDGSANISRRFRASIAVGVQSDKERERPQEPGPREVRCHTRWCALSVSNQGALPTTAGSTFNFSLTTRYTMSGFGQSHTLPPRKHESRLSYVDLRLQR